jgi:restriction system protein
VSEGAFLTTGLFTAEARAFADQKNVHLIDGPGLLIKINDLLPDKRDDLLRRAVAGDFITPTCPSCGIKFVRRTSSTDGETFWGCVNFPSCRSTMKMRAHH